jgi:ribosomal protein S18 acetylase RimI-like enzyme
MSTTDPANGPWRHYLEDQADKDRKAKFLGDEDLGCFAHERSWEAGELAAVGGQDLTVSELLVKAFYVGRASAGRERPHGRRMVSEALNECHRRYQKVAAEVFSQVMSSRGAE